MTLPSIIPSTPSIIFKPLSSTMGIKTHQGTQSIFDLAYDRGTVEDNKGKKNFLVKTWNRCQSFPNTRSGKSLHDQETKDKKMTPEGYFPVCAGPEKQRFMVKTKYANHPLFKMLLEDAETEYGYNSDGPITLPCDVDLFDRVLAEMEAKVQPLGWSFAYGSCSPFNPSRRLSNVTHQIGKGYGSYGPLTPSNLIKLN